ncbi:dormancy-associated protein homolog 3-like [Actinidia eriantha]|uniref:dormancy-associated protein homolog 3-like n=1 Tax=Actinidia eriantha TaxID=165200 RepID=UPI002590D7AD|nr:dormancy-associated protein homolog 3-like [Actinidia eriantha]
MSLLDQLWDDTVAGPPPESGLGKLRKQPSFTPPSRSGKESDGGGSSEEGLKVSRRIMIVKPPITQSGSPPVSPAGSTPPVSPFAGGGEGYRLFRRRSLSDAYEKPSGIRPGSPRPPYNV